MHPILILLALCISFVFDAAAQPAQILLIRHAEKPKDKARTELSLKGYERAAALVPFFLKNPAYLENGPPVAIYAQTAAHETSSIRPIETVTPLAAELGQKVITTYHRDDYERMVKDILSNPKYEGKTILISWGHRVIGKMAHAFGATNAPSKWPSVFDRVWRISYKPNGTITFEDLPQKLLYKDSSR